MNKKMKKRRENPRAATQCRQRYWLTKYIDNYRMYAVDYGQVYE